MSFFEAIILGIVQGLTEFLPISSTAHLRIIPSLVGWPDPGAPFTAVSQIGTLLAVLVFYRSDVMRLSAAWFRSVSERRISVNKDSMLAWNLLLATVPIVVAGLLLKDLIEDEFRSLYVISASLIVLALLLAVSEKLSRFSKPISALQWHHIFIIGIAQAFALIPGASRSGTTITAGLFLDMKREDAASFSFLLSIPAVALSGLYQAYKLRDALLTDFGISMIIAILVSAVIGYLSIAFMLRYLRTHTTHLFIGYRIVLGVAILLLLNFNLLRP